MTTKGELVRAILFPPPLDLAFYDDFLKSVRVFLALGLGGMTYSLYMWISLGVSSLMVNCRGTSMLCYSGHIQGVSSQQFGHLYICCEPYVAARPHSQQCLRSEETPEERNLLPAHQAHQSLRGNRRCGF